MNKPTDDIYIGVLITALHDLMRTYDSVNSPEDRDRIMMSFISRSTLRFNKFDKEKQRFLVNKTKRLINNLIEESISEN